MSKRYISIKNRRRARSGKNGLLALWLILVYSHANTNQSRLAAQFAQKAYALRDRVSEREQLTIRQAYYWFVTGETEKRIEEAELRKRLYPKDPSAFTNLASGYAQTGQYESAVSESREALRLNPNSAVPYSQLGNFLIHLNRFSEAREINSQAAQRNLDSTSTHESSYQIAFANGETAETQAQVDWAKDRPNEYVSLEWQTAAAIFGGQWRRARELSRRSVDLATRNDAKDITAQYAAEAALSSAVLRRCTETMTAAKQALALERHRQVTASTALALTLCGETTQGQRLIDGLVRLYPNDTRINGIWAPLVRAAIELHRGNALQALRQTQPAIGHEAAAEFWPQYLRGLVFLRLGRGAESAVEFQKILDHRGEGVLSVLYPLAHLGLAQAALSNGDQAKARQAYQDFFRIWKDADADLPMLIQAKRQYQKLKPNL